MASSANSLDRIHMTTKDKDFYISLKDNDDFIKNILLKKNVISIRVLMCNYNYLK